MKHRTNTMQDKLPITER